MNTETEDPRDFREFYEENVAAVYRYIWRRLPPPVRDEVSDGVVEVFAVAWRRWPAPPAGHEQTWLLAVARRVVSDHLRAHSRRTRLVTRIAAQPESTSVYIDRTTSKTVQNALSRLSERDRELIRLIAWDDLSRDEAALVMGCSVGALNTRLHRALRRLERALRINDVKQVQTGQDRDGRTTRTSGPCNVIK